MKSEEIKKIELEEENELQMILEKLRKAWAEAPEGMKSYMKKKGYKHQNTSHILLYGRKDKNILLELLDEVKKASKKAAEKAVKQNDKVQAI